MTSALGSMAVDISLNDGEYIQGLTRAEYATQRAARTAEREAARMTAAAKLAQRQMAETAQLSTAMTAKQINAAMRGVPAQLTDIVVSLQGGQAPMTVLLQQGGQLKDMFGGAGVAARALGGYVLSLVNPATAAAAAAALIGYAFYNASNEASDLRKNLILTGTASGASFDQLVGYAENVSDAFGVTQGAASSALGTIVATGTVARQNLEEFTRVAMQAESAFGISIEDIAKNFQKLGQEPVKASMELNKSLGFLTQATFDQIIAAEKLGNREQSAAIAQKEYSRALATRATEVQTNAGYMQQAFSAVAKTAKEAWDAMLGVGREDSLATQIEKAEKRIAGMNASSDAMRRNAAMRGQSLPGPDAEVAAEKKKLDALREMQRIQRIGSDKAAENRKKEDAAIAKSAKEYEESLKKTRASKEDPAIKAARDAMEADFQFIANSGLARIKANEDAAKALEEKTKTPIEKLTELEAQYKKLLDGRYIGEETYWRARMDAQDAYQKQIDEEAASKSDIALKNDAKAMTERLRTPVEKLADDEAKIAKMRKAGFLDDETYNRARMQAYDDYIQARDKDESRVNEQAIEQARRLGDAYASTFSQALQGGMKFGDLLKKLAIDTISIQFLTPWAQSAGSSLAKGIGSLFSGKSFAGGGYTGDGSRSGGLDGQGGYLAMLHPQETVIDHAQGQRISLTSDSGGAVNISQVFNFGNSDASTVAALRAEAGRIKAETLAAVQAKANRGGSFARAVGRA